LRLEWTPGFPVDSSAGRFSRIASGREP
jgi:hypothetical protein